MEIQPGAFIINDLTKRGGLGGGSGVVLGKEADLKGWSQGCPPPQHPATWFGSFVTSQGGLRSRGPSLGGGGGAQWEVSLGEDLAVIGSL